MSLAPHCSPSMEQTNASSSPAREEGYLIGVIKYFICSYNLARVVVVALPV